MYARIGVFGGGAKQFPLAAEQHTVALHGNTIYFFLFRIIYLTRSYEGVPSISGTPDPLVLAWFGFHDMGRKLSSPCLIDTCLSFPLFCGGKARGMARNR